MSPNKGNRETVTSCDGIEETSHLSTQAETAYTADIKGIRTLHNEHFDKRSQAVPHQFCFCSG